MSLNVLNVLDLAAVQSVERQQTSDTFKCVDVLDVAAVHSLTIDPMCIH
jgi:hypothetical protein